jgi:hypothetical protein
MESWKSTVKIENFEHYHSWKTPMFDMRCAAKGIESSNPEIKTYDLTSWATTCIKNYLKLTTMSHILKPYNFPWKSTISIFQSESFYQSFLI